MRQTITKPFNRERGNRFSSRVAMANGIAKFAK